MKIHTKFSEKKKIKKILEEQNIFFLTAWFSHVAISTKIGSIFEKGLINDDGFFNDFRCYKASRNTFTRCISERRNIRKSASCDTIENLCLTIFSKFCFVSNAHLVDFEVKRPYCCFYVTLIFLFLTSVFN